MRKNHWLPRGQRKFAPRQHERTLVGADFYADPEQAVPVLYGRRRIEGRLIEARQIVESGPDLVQFAWFLLIGEGEIDSVVDLIVDGKSEPDVIVGSVKTFGLYYRQGLIGTTDTETAAEYAADAATRLRAQNIDYRTATATPYSRSAYAIVVKNQNATDGGSIDDLPNLLLDVKGKKIQAYNADGSAAGAVAFSDNPVWQLVDAMLGYRFGCRLGAGDIDFAIAKESADIAGAAISSTEASTKVTANQAVATTQCKVSSTVGFLKGRACKLNGVDNTIADIVGETEITLGTAVTQTAGWTLVQYPPRFASNVWIDQVDDAVAWVEQLLLTCRGYLTYDAGKMQIRIERAHCTDLLSALNGNLDTWSSSTNAGSWTEVVSGACTVTQETVDVHTVGGSAAKLSRVDGGNLWMQLGLGASLVPGQWYRLAFWAKGGTAATKIRAGVRNSTKSKEIQTDGVTWGSITHYAVDQLATTSYALYELTFLVDPSFGAADSYIAFLYGELIGDYVLFDDVVLYGPISGDFRDFGAMHEMKIAAGSFKWELASDTNEINQVKISFDNESDDAGHDQVAINDWDHQRTHPVKSMTVSADAIVDRDQAYRIGYSLLRKARGAPGASLTVGPVGLPIQPGDVILITHAVPNWSRQPCRVVSKRTIGLGDNDELFVAIEIEPYDETVYTDTALAALLPLAQAAPTLTLTLVSAAAKRVVLDWTLSASYFKIDAFRIHKSPTASFGPSSANLVDVVTAYNYVYAAREAEVNTTLYFKVVAVTPAGLLISNEVTAFISAVGPESADDTLLQGSGHKQLVYDGDLTTPGNWTQQTTGATTVFPTTQTGGYTNPTNAMDDDADEASATSSGLQHVWKFADLGIFSGQLQVYNRDIDGSLGQDIHYSTDGGANWTLLVTSSHTSEFNDSVNLTSVDMKNLWVRATSTGGTGSGVGVSRIKFVPTIGTTSMASGIASLKAAGDGSISRIYRAFPLQITAARKHFPPGSKLSCAIAIRRTTDGTAPNGDSRVLIRQSGGGWTQTLVTIVAADIPSSSGAYLDIAVPGVAVDPAIPSAALEVAIETDSRSTGVDVDKLVIAEGDFVPAFTASVPELSGASGTIGDYGTGASGSARTKPFPPGPPGSKRAYTE